MRRPLHPSRFLPTSLTNEVMADVDGSARSPQEPTVGAEPAGAPMPADGKVGVSPASNGSPRAAPSAAALAIIRQTPNLFERLAALNKRLEAQTERLEEVARPSLYVLGTRLTLPK